jgi:hypothetical protein
MAFTKLHWPQMRALAVELINHMHSGHALGAFSLPVVEFVSIFSPDASPEEIAKVAERGELQFVADESDGGSFTLAEGERALFDLHREGLVLRIPTRMSGRYTLREGGFTVSFNQGEELEGCKRLILLICNRVLSVDVSTERVDVHLPGRIFDLCVEFD